MAIAIPTVVDNRLASLKASILPHTDAITCTSAVSSLFPSGNQIADLLELLTNLIDSGTLTATAGSTTSVTDAGAFTGVNSLIGCEITFDGNVTAVLTGVSAIVLSNTVNTLTLDRTLSDAPQAGDTFTLVFAAVDPLISAIRGGKLMGEAGYDPYRSGLTVVAALYQLIEQLGGVIPSWLKTEPFTVGNPYAGGSTGHGGSQLFASALQLARDTVAAYTAPV